MALLAGDFKDAGYGSGYGSIDGYGYGSIDGDGDGDGIMQGSAE